MFISQTEVKLIKKSYPVGAVIEVDHMSDAFHPIPKGTRGVIRTIDDAGQIHVNWDHPSGLALIPYEDAFHLCIDDPRNIRVIVNPDISIDSDLNLNFIHYTFRNIANNSDLASGFYVLEDNEDLPSDMLCDIAYSILDADKDKFINLPLVKDTPVWFQFMFKWLIESDNNMAFSSDCEDVQSFFIDNSADILSFIENLNLFEKGVLELDETDEFNIVAYPMLFHEFNTLNWDRSHDFQGQLEATSQHDSNLEL